MKKWLIAVLFPMVAYGMLCQFASAQNSIPEQQDARVIDRLRQNGSDLSKPHPIDFFLDFTNQQDAAAAATQLEKLGYQIQFVGKTNDGKQWEIHAKRQLVPALETMQALSRSLGALAAAHDGYYDGWGTLIIK